MGIGLSTPKIRGGKDTYTHTINQSTVRRNRILPSRPTHRHQAEDFRVLRDTSPTQRIHRHTRGGRATNAAGNAKEERSNKAGAHSNTPTGNSKARRPSTKSTNKQYSAR